MPYKNKEEFDKYQKEYRENPVRRQKAKERSAKWYINNKERAIKNNIRNHRKRDAIDRVENPKLFMLRRVKNRACTTKIECTITVDDFDLPDVCPILGIPLVFHKGKARDDSPSIDRIDNNKGYIPGNVCVISKAANRMKSDLTLEILDKLREYVFNQKERLQLQSS